MSNNKPTVQPNTNAPDNLNEANTNYETLIAIKMIPNASVTKSSEQPNIKNNVPNKLVNQAQEQKP